MAQPEAGDRDGAENAPRSPNADADADAGPVPDRAQVQVQPNAPVPMQVQEQEQEHARPRRRTRRACDKCSTSRTRCDGESPCRRCQEYGYTCRYTREVKKRGRLPASASGSRGSVSRDSDQASHSSPPATPPASAISAPASAPRSAPKPSHEPTLGQPEPMDQDPHPPREPPRRDSDINIPQATMPRSMHAMSIPSLTQAGIQRSPRPPLSADGPAFRLHAAPSSVSALEGHMAESEMLISDESAGYPSPATGSQSADTDRPGASVSTATTAPDGFLPDVMPRAPTEECCYRFLDPVLPFIRRIIPASVACELLDIFLTDPGSSLFRGASPYILTRIFRKKSITHPTNPRHTTPALLATILWCVAQTADVMLLHVPGTRARVVNDLYDLATSLVSERDPDRWRRIHGGLRAENETPHPSLPNPASVPMTTAANEPAGVIDDVLTFILLSIAVSGGDFKSDCYKWWSKAVRLAFSLRLNREDERCSAPVSPCANPLCPCHRDNGDTSLANLERREERRRVFWLLYSLDRHLGLSFNTVLSMPDSYCEVYAPLPEAVWENLDVILARDLPMRTVGPPTLASGTGFFEYFLPMMAILGDIIEVHHRRRHPRLGAQQDGHSVAVVQELLASYELSLASLTADAPLNSPLSSLGTPVHANRDLVTGLSTPALYQEGMRMAHDATDRTKVRLVKAYSTHILHVLHVLLHGKWDAISMLDDGDDWITSKRFTECAAHAISASQSVSTILALDPELTFMSYLFGIYLLQGSFILLLFADRMPQLGPNESVEQACENIIRAHEVCVVTLSTEFQKNFRKVVRSTLYSVRGSGTTNWEEHRARRRALSLYRWTKGARGLAL
ncbi:fungal specific transcription factor [Hirsutella rhossiliensis]|uniref:Fungal specific transcription factor domain-containing protein n=1 Tax=Hirsutella rhossiliensis TaxID=111463 RepID=A0A9P8SD48_9HYPO|nr:fungal specific transcription factor domain-containing protein [Hirsutella rhossiliensis]KAH0958231.1 fungal specific transcription factor domain-containing protein [Hirsutella rhossiliensis]